MKLSARNNRRTCISIYDIDPKTDIIIRVGFEGKEYTTLGTTLWPRSLSDLTS
jgi:hypothetical protein